MIFNMNFSWVSFCIFSRDFSLNSFRDYSQISSRDANWKFLRGFFVNFPKNSSHIFFKIPSGIPSSTLYGLLHEALLVIFLELFKHLCQEEFLMYSSRLFSGNYPGILLGYWIFLDFSWNSSMMRDASQKFAHHGRGMFPKNLQGTLSVTSFRYVSHNSLEISPENFARITFEILSKIAFEVF